MSVAGLQLGILVNGADGEPEVRRIVIAYERGGDEIADFQKNLFPKLPAVFEAEEKRQFDAQGGGPSGSWKQLNDDYEAWKSKHYPGNPILVLEDYLHQALTSSSSPFAERSFSADEFSFGTTGVPYASYHQLGTDKMDARPVFDMSPDFERDLDDVTRQHIRDAIRNSGLEEFTEVTP